MTQTLNMSKFRPFRPLAMRSCVLRGYSEFPALVIADRRERGFTDLYPHEREIARAQAAHDAAQAQLQAALSGGAA